MYRLGRSFRTGAFYPHRLIGRVTGLSFPWQNAAVTLVFAIALTIGAIVDQNMYLEGADVGFVEHPTIWIFLAFQFSVPVLLKRSILKLLSNEQAISAVFSANVRQTRIISQRAGAFLKRESPFALTVWSFSYLFGIAAFSWNSIQNQLPVQIVGYDFWDSTTYAVSYWVTRVYKLYLFVFLLPQIAFIVVAINTALIEHILDAGARNELKLRPFHPDKAGGFSFFPRLLTDSLFPILVLMTLANVAAYSIHMDFDATPVMGTVAITLLVLLCYFVPIQFLKIIISKLKREYMLRISELQQDEADKALSPLDSATKFDPEPAERRLDYYDRLKTAVRNVSSYPHLVLYMSLAGVAGGPLILHVAGALLKAFLALKENTAITG